MSQTRHDSSGAALEDRFIHLEASLPLDAARSIIEANPDLWYVVDDVIDSRDSSRSTRPSSRRSPGAHFRVANGHEFLNVLAAVAGGALIGDSSDDVGRLVSVDTLGGLLHLLPLSPSVSMGPPEYGDTSGWLQEASRIGQHATTQRLVIHDDGVPVGVVAPSAPGPDPSPTRSDRDGPRWLSRGPSDRAGSAVDPTPKVEQHMLAETVSQLRIDEEAEIRITISGTAESGQRENSAAVSALVEEGVDLMLLVRDRGSVRLTDQWRSAVPVQSIDEAAVRKFAFRATGAGRGSLLVELLQGTEALASVELGIRVSGDPQPLTQAQAATAVVEPGEGSRSTLLVEPRGDATLVFHLAMPNADIDWRRGEVSLTATAEDAGRFFTEFEQVRGTRRPFEGFQLAEMRGLGVRLANLIPEEVSEVLWQERESVDGIELRSTLAKWPWELCCLANRHGEVAADRPFFAERGMTRRWPNRVHPKEIRMDGSKIASAPDYTMMRALNLRAGAEESAGLQSSFGFQSGPTSTADLINALNGGDFSIFHFAGHSVLPAIGDEGFGLPRLVLNDTTFAGGNDRQVRSGLSPTMLVGRSMTERSPLVFLNACTTGGVLDPVGGGGGTSGFPDSFLAAGAGAFIGTHWEVEDSPAKAFANMFYERFLQQGDTLADAVSAARSTASGSGWSPTPLAYVAYGRPDAVAVTGE